MRRCIIVRMIFLSRRGDTSPRRRTVSVNQRIAAFRVSSGTGPSGPSV
jgi:hypothetical protein